jgi:hypothetical protein
VRNERLISQGEQDDTLFIATRSSGGDAGSACHRIAHLGRRW